MRRLLMYAAMAAVVVGAMVLSASTFVTTVSAGYLYEAGELQRRPSKGLVVAIVPGARVWPSGEPSAALADRLECARALYEGGVVQRVLVSGDHGAVEYDEPNAMRSWLLERGVESADVFMDHAGFRTLDTMQRASAVFGVRRAVVCTQRFHLPRSVFLARHAGIDAVGVVSDRREYPAALYDGLRETLARARAYVDVALGTGPALLGPPLSIEGQATETHDAWTAQR